MNRLICLCKGIREEKILEAIESGDITMAKIQSSTGAATNCGRCIPLIDEMIIRHKKSSLKE